MDFDALGKTHEQLFGKNAPKKKPDNFQALSDWFGQIFGINATTNSKGKTTTTPKAPTAVNMAVAQGPTAYSDAMRANLGFAPAGAAPAPAPTTGMAALPSAPYWSSPTESTPPTLEQVLGIYTTPPAPTMPAPAPTPTPKPSAGSNGNGNWRSLIDRNSLSRRDGLRPRYNGGFDG